MLRLDLYLKKDLQMKEMIDYFLTMITPPVEDAKVLVAKPSEIDFESHLVDDTRGYASGAIVTLKRPTVHGIILLGEPTEEEAKQIHKILKPGGHCILIPEDIGYKGVINLEDTGFEVRDAIFVAEDPDSFYYTSKASRSEREAGLEAYDSKTMGMSTGSLSKIKQGEEEYQPPEGLGYNKLRQRKNVHPTVKPIEIMEWCARDVSPKSKVVDPFLGSGTTGIAMSRKGHEFVGIELNPEYASICEARIRHWMPIGSEIKSEAGVGKAEAQEGETLSIFDLF